MKNLRSLFFFFLLPILLLSQDQYSMIQENAKWINQAYFELDVSPGETIHTEYWLEGDTIIDNKTFRNLYSTWGYEGALREEDKRLLHATNSGIEIILDFNLEIGDTVNIQCPAPGQDECQFMVLESIDAITTLDGNNRKRLNFHGYNAGTFLLEEFDASWIDGIGSTRGLIIREDCAVLSFSSQSPVCWSKLKCYELAGDLVFSNSGDIETCDTLGIIDNINELSSKDIPLQISPNPIQQSFTLSFEQANIPAPWRYIIYDELGQMIQRSEWLNTRNLSINLREAPNGFYILSVQTQEGSVSRKLIKS